jgi:hypothetical protein
MQINVVKSVTHTSLGNCATGVCSQIFEGWGRIAASVLQRYWSDMYQDVRFLDRVCVPQLIAMQPNQKLVIYWGVRDCGTHMCIDPVEPNDGVPVEDYLKSWRFTFGKFRMFRLTIAKAESGFFSMIEDEITVELAP